ncbi:hypothetical protein MSG28_007809 [Choristoneura fumiferana]|uniref:Uncharacterized protein n=1 Tax=Choristoneura fumiferana TaxID=7141 RepID=A0ACC0JYU5_CHOFU|nr:hypothetical protein MSG28_007809 [Choristoneura fumiferana]
MPFKSETWCFTFGLGAYKFSNGDWIGKRTGPHFEAVLADEGKTTCMPTTWKGVDIDVDEDESVNVYDVPTTESYEKTDPVNSNERSTHTSSTSAPFDGDKEWSPVTEERCHGRAICKDLLQG